MLNRMTRWLRRDEPLSSQEQLQVRLIVGALAVIGFVLITTVIVSLDSLFSLGNTTDLEPGDIVPADILSPISMMYVSDVLTEQRRQTAAAGVSPVYDPPDPSVARQQVQLLRQIMDYVDGVRRDPYGTSDQKQRDLRAITSLTLDDPLISAMLTLDDDTWRAIDGEAIVVLERVMRESIREADLPLISVTLPTQVSVRFDPEAAAIVVALVEDMIRVNRQQNPDATEQARDVAAGAVPPETRSFERGQIVLRAGARVDAADYEALSRLGLLETDDLRTTQVMRALLASILVVLTMGLYVATVESPLSRQPELLVLVAVLFLLFLFAARVVSGGDNQLNVLYPAAALGLVVVVLAQTDIALVCTLGLALLVGLMFNNSLEAAALVGGGGLMGALVMQRTERINRYFFAGAVIGLTNVLITTVFTLNTAEERDTSLTLLYMLVNGIISAMTALAVVYVVTLLFNLSTNLKLVELNQPSQPLLQRLLREAPGTYQHSLQVANLAEQAANAIGAKADLVRVSALYHDIGKVLNPAFFVENQVEGQNPHDTLNDPYRSADIIINHVVDGERLARQYRLPARVRDFILEHHGTTMVSFFYNRAILQTGDPEAIDPKMFTYPGPRPRSRETAVMMLADSCESTVRARKPANRQEISDIVSQIFETRIREGQLDESNLTLNDIETTRVIFVDMLQAVFHPRINYPAPAVLPTAGSRAVVTRPLVSALKSGDDVPSSVSTGIPGDEIHGVVSVEGENAAGGGTAAGAGARLQPAAEPVSGTGRSRTTAAVPSVHVHVSDDDDVPMPEVPPLPRPAKDRSVPPKAAAADEDSRAADGGESDL